MSNNKLRPFSDLIVNIVSEEQSIVPIIEIAKLAFNYNDLGVSGNPNRWINESYDGRAWFTFEPNIVKEHTCSIGVWRDYSISIYHCIDNNQKEFAASNQVKIFKLLTKWGFIE